MAEFKGKDVSWKLLWQLISGIHYETPCNVVADKLHEVVAELRDGILSKTPDTAIAKVIKDKTTLLQFSSSLEHYLGLTPVQASNLICSYLVNEYKGSATSLLNLLATDQQKQKLLADIGKYFALERLVLLKVLRNILELHTSKNHPYSGEYAAVLQQITLPVLLRSYIAQLGHLIREPVPSQQPHTVSDFSGYGTAKLVAWAERKNHEIVEVLQILLLLVEHAGIEAAQLSELFALFRLHSFGRQQHHLDANNVGHVDLVNKVIYSEVALFMKCCADGSNDATARSATFVADAISRLQTPVAALTQHAEHGPILLTWMLFTFQSSATGVDADDDTQLRNRQFGSRAIQLGVFEFLHTMIGHAMYTDGSVTARLVRRTVYAHLTDLCNLFDGDGSVAGHHKIYDLLTELLRTPALAKDFCGREDGVRSLYNTALENFPLDFVALSCLAEAIASTGAQQQAFIRKQLENLPIYTELLKPARSFHMKPLADGDNEFVLLSKCSPFAKIDFEIPAGTTAIVQDKPFGSTIHFRTTVNYFNVLHNEINELLAETLRYTADIDAVRERRVCAGIKYLAQAVRNVTDPLRGISSEMVHPTEMVFDILTKFKAVQQPPIELLAKCLAVCANLVPLFDEEIVRRVVNLNVLPYVTQSGGDYRQLCGGAGFESGLVGYYLINFEKNCGRYDFLLTYLEFLHVYAKNSTSQSNDIELPGLVFILREVLPHMHGWHFEKETDRQEIYTHIFKYLLNVLQASDDDGVARVTLRNVCVDSLLNLDNGMVLLRFIAIGNDHLQSVMQNVSNWMTAAETGLNQLVQLAMTTLMQILRLRNKSHHTQQPDQLSPLESIIYTQPKQRDTLRIIPVVTSYMSNIFNRRLPLLACRLLRRFAIEFQMSLLACLDMEPDQIRLTFLARLPDDLESDQLKMAVIEFVEACISKQPGLTEAFFRIRNERRYADKGPRPKEIGDGILTYMTQYLNAVSADPQRVASPLLSKILALFHALWKNNMQSLVQDLKTPTAAEGDFWTALCKPLFVDIQPGIPAYSQLFNMLGIELFRATNSAQVDASLEAVFKRLLAPQCLNKWVDSILTLPKDTIGDQVTNETPEWLCRLQSFKDFIVLAIRRRKANSAAPDCCEIPAESLKYFADKCLTVLVERSEYMEDVRPFIILAELYLMLMLSCDGKYTDTADEDDRLLHNITKLLNQTAISYRDIHGRARESILAIALHGVVLLAKDMGRQPEVTVDFMRSVVEVLCFELQHTENQIIGYRQTPDEDAAIATNGAHHSFVLGLNLLKQITSSVAANDQFVAHWTAEILSNRILNRLLSCLNAALPVHRFRRIVVEMLDVLIQLAQSACSAELLHSDIVNYLWMRLLPPKEMLQIFGGTTGTAHGTQSDRSQLGGSSPGGFNVSSSSFAAGHSGMMADQSVASVGGGPSVAAVTQQRWQTNDWWPIYARGIQLVTVLLQQHGHIFLKDALLFVGVHEEYVEDAVLLAKHTMDADAVVLIKTALLLVCELVQYEKQWRLEHATSMINLMRSVQSIMDHSVSLLYRPNILQQLMDKTAVTPAARAGLQLFGVNNAAHPTPELITAMNDLIDVVTICCRSLLNFSPKLLDMLVETQFVPSQWQPLVEIQFGAPKLYVSHASPQLSFGSVLSAASIFVKSLNLQSYTFHDTPINKLTIRPLCEDDDDFSDETIDERDLHDSVADQSIANETTQSATLNMSATRSMLTKSLSMTSNASSAATTVAAPSNETLSNLDSTKCLRALEFVLTLLCSQSLLALKDGALSVREKQLIKRELSTELAVFHDFVRKRIMCDARGPLHRKKRGVAQIRAADGSFEAIKQQPSGGPTASTAATTAGGSAADRNAAAGRHRPTMREKVMRQQHQLTAAAAVTAPSQTPSVGLGGGASLKRAPIDLSPIVSDTPSAPAKKSSGATEAAASSTPIVSILSSGGAAAGKRVTFPTNPVTRSQQKFGERSVDTVDMPPAAVGAYDETVFVGSEDSTFTGLSMVQLVEADYLHLLSLVFMHICQHD